MGIKHSFLLDRALFDLENLPAGKKRAALCVRGEASGTSSGTVTVIGRELPTHQNVPCPASIKRVSSRKRALIVQELCESRGGRPGLSVLTSLLISVDVKNY